MSIGGIRLPRSELREYASRYSYPAEASVEALVPVVKERGYLLKSELQTVGEWKSARIRPRLAKNSDGLVKETTRLALATGEPRLAAHILMALDGVALPVASTILHWFHSDPFPILDFRAVWSLGIPEPKSYSWSFWEEYVTLTRALAKEWNTNMRTLDRALWQYSFERQPAD